MKLLKKISWIRNYGMGVRDEYTEYNSYFLQCEIPNLYFVYDSKPKTKWDEIIKNVNKQKPCDMLMTEKTPEELALDENTSSYGYSDYKPVKFVEITGLVAQNILLALAIPAKYEDHGIEVVVKQSPEITDEIKEAIDKEIPQSVIAIYGEDYSQMLDKDAKKSKILKAYCLNCGTKFNTERIVGYCSNVECPNCSDKKIQHQHCIVDTKLKKHRTEQYGNNSGETFYSVETKIPRKFLFLEAIPNGVRIYAISRDDSLSNGKFTQSYSVSYSVTHVIGGEISAYKHMKNEKKPCDSFTALNINTKTLRFSRHIIYANADDFFDFAEKNEKILNMSGFMDTLKYTSHNIENLDSFFVMYIAILNKYPILEQIIKMGHSKLFFDLFGDMMNSQNKDELSQKVEVLGQLVNNDTTKGKNSLRIPPYIGDYLIKKSAHLTEYYYWRDVYEITNISKDNFEKLVNSFNFAYINSQIGFQDIGNILKYGYDPMKLNSYLIKQFKKTKKDYGRLERIVYYLSDYLQTCELMDIEPDKFPMDLTKQHTDVMSAYRKLEANKYDKRLGNIGNACEKYFESLDDKKVGVPKLMEEYCVVFPKSEADFMTEGNMQHNCVGSYPAQVRNGNCIIFFLRKKDKPNISYITGECTRGGLRQFYLSNNRYVTDEDVIELGKFIANLIRKGCNSGKIPGLNNIDK